MGVMVRLRWRVLLRGVLGSLLLLLLVWSSWIALWYWREPALMKKMFTYPYRSPITRVGWYRPLERVPGRFVAPLPLASKSKRAFLAKLYAPAIAYAKRKNSAALLVLHKGEVVLERYWMGHHTDALSNSMSMAKTLVGLLVGAAIRDGHIAAETTPASRYLRQWRQDRRRHIQIRHLLQMHSGLRGDGKIWQIGSDITQLYFHPRVLGYLWRIPAIQAAGAEFLYKDVDSQVLGALLEAATKQRFARYLSEKLWQPIGAPDGFVWLDHKGGMARTSCCFFTTARAWARVGLLLMQKGRWQGKDVIDPHWIKKMLTPSPTEPEYGYQIWLNASGRFRQDDRAVSFLANDIFYLDGKFRQRVYVMPSAQLVVVRIGERARRWDDTMLPNAIFHATSSWSRTPR